mmetsp:Transcript_6570/g.19836  ORF Transcript_6570/g.19836 Transcript_6570/m.19836 type:complete len:348 (-) Transcript_6570:83-1126(-)
MKHFCRPSKTCLRVTSLSQAALSRHDAMFGWLSWFVSRTALPVSLLSNLSISAKIFVYKPALSSTLPPILYPKGRSDTIRSTLPDLSGTLVASARMIWARCRPAVFVLADSTIASSRSRPRTDPRPPHSRCASASTRPLPTQRSSRTSPSFGSAARTRPHATTGSRPLTSTFPSLKSACLAISTPTSTPTSLSSTVTVRSPRTLTLQPARSSTTPPSASDLAISLVECPRSTFPDRLTLNWSFRPPPSSFAALRQSHSSASNLARSSRDSGLPWGDDSVVSRYVIRYPTRSRALIWPRSSPKARKLEIGHLNTSLPCPIATIASSTPRTARSSSLAALSMDLAAIVA